jgi:DNA-binding NtrC family response regulator
MTAQRTILVVDDDPDLRKGLSTMLGQRGYRTLQADDGWEARQLIDEFNPDLVIVDMMMPRWGGLAVLEHFRGKAGAPPFIMISANDGQRHKNYAERLGVFDFIAKPFSMDRLLEGVAKVMPTPAAPTQQASKSQAASKSIKCRCPGCGSRIKAPIQLLGQTRTCPGCRAAFVLSVAPPEDEGPTLVVEDGELFLRPPQGTRRPA